MSEDEMFVRAHCPNAVLDKLYESDDTTFSWAVFDAEGSLVYGSGKTQEEAWSSARINSMVRDQSY